MILIEYGMPENYEFMYYKANMTKSCLVLFIIKIIKFYASQLY